MSSMRLLPHLITPLISLLALLMTQLTDLAIYSLRRLHDRNVIVTISSLSISRFSLIGCWRVTHVLVEVC